MCFIYKNKVAVFGMLANKRHCILFHLFIKNKPDVYKKLINSDFFLFVALK